MQEFLAKRKKRGKHSTQTSVKPAQKRKHFLLRPLEGQWLDSSKALLFVLAAVGAVLLAILTALVYLNPSAYQFFLPSVELSEYYYLSLFLGFVFLALHFAEDVLPSLKEKPISIFSHRIGFFGYAFLGLASFILALSFLPQNFNASGVIITRTGDSLGVAAGLLLGLACFYFAYKNVRQTRVLLRAR